MIRFDATLLKPSTGEDWLFLVIPQDASEKFSSRGMVSVEGTICGVTFQATLEPDGKGGHWLKVDKDLANSAHLHKGELATLEIQPVSIEPEPKVPDDFDNALANAPEKARQTWSAITALARRDWIFWITSGKKAETRSKRIAVAIDKLSKGSRRPCCFDRSGMYSNSLSCPAAES